MKSLFLTVLFPVLLYGQAADYQRVSTDTLRAHKRTNKVLNIQDTLKTTVALDTPYIAMPKIRGWVGTYFQPLLSDAANIAYLDKGNPFIRGAQWTGTTNGLTYASGAMTSMLWVPSLGVLAAGVSDDTVFNISNLGTSSAIFGEENLNIYGFANLEAGYLNSANSAHYSLVSGERNSASSNGDVVGGISNSVSGAASFTVGTLDTATATNDFVGGAVNYVNGNYGTAFGYSNSIVGFKPYDFIRGAFNRINDLNQAGYVEVGGAYMTSLRHSVYLWGLADAQDTTTSSL